MVSFEQPQGMVSLRQSDERLFIKLPLKVERPKQDMISLYTLSSSIRLYSVYGAVLSSDIRGVFSSMVIPSIASMIIQFLVFSFYIG
jgi:hypothetical protein